MACEWAADTVLEPRLGEPALKAREGFGARLRSKQAWRNTSELARLVQHVKEELGAGCRLSKSAECRPWLVLRLHMLATTLAFSEACLAA